MKSNTPDGEKRVKSKIKTPAEKSITPDEK
jgi:hypothetical protein